MKLEILLSCMNQKDFSIVKESCITGDVLLINQANDNSLIENNNDKQSIRMISTTERGLSRSRNMAIRNSNGDICLLSDDDEIFSKNYEKIILDSYLRLQDADIIAFDVANKVTRLSKKTQRIGYFNSLKLSSCQLSFKRASILKHNIWFDPFMGAGTGNGCGEENKFLLDCLKAKMKIYYVPATISVLDTKESSWFSGYDREFFYQRGAATRRMMGLLPSVCYGVYYLLFKRELYTPTISMKNAVMELLHGIIENPIQKQVINSKQKDVKGKC